MIAGVTWQEVASMSWWMMVATAVSILLWWSIKSGKLRIVPFGPGHFGFKESLGYVRKDKPLGRGPHLHIAGVNVIRRENRLPVTRSFLMRFKYKGETCLLHFRYVSLIEDTSESKYQAIYGTYDQDGGDLQNAERLNYVDTKVAGAVRSIVMKADKSNDATELDLSLENILRHSGAKLKSVAGTLLDDFIIIEDTPVDGQIIGSSIQVAGENIGEALKDRALMAEVVDAISAAK